MRQPLIQDMCEDLLIQFWRKSLTKRIAYRCNMRNLIQKTVFQNPSVLYIDSNIPIWTYHSFDTFRKYAIHNIQAGNPKTTLLPLCVIKVLESKIKPPISFEIKGFLAKVHEVDTILQELAMQQLFAFSLAGIYMSLPNGMNHILSAHTNHIVK